MSAGRAGSIASLALAAASACAASAPRGGAQSAATPAPVVAAERAFAADGLAHGVKASFLAHSAADAIVLGPDPTGAHESLAAMPDVKPGEKRAALVWWPVWAGVSRSGDLGFTTGPFTLDGAPMGHYFTVWKKQPDGAWKWVFDGGVEVDPTGQPPASAPVGYLPLAAAGSASPESAAAEVRAAEDDLARRAARDLGAAYLAYLADDGRLHTAGMPPAVGRAAFAGALSRRGRAIELAYLGGGASRAGDLVWTYGDARWTGDGQPRRGHYVRVWQKRAAGWRVVFDQIVPVREQ
jgi:ketosteroid isomerase-like protein